MMYVLKENKERSISLVLFPQDILWGIIKNVPSKVLPFMSLSWQHSCNNSKCDLNEKRPLDKINMSKAGALKGQNIYSEVSL